MCVRRDQFAEMMVGRAQAPFRHHDEMRIPHTSRDHVQLLGEIEARADFAGRDVVRRQSHDDGNDLRQVVDLVAQLTSAPVRGANLPATA